MTELIKKLRTETGAGMLDCKKALETHDGKYENAKAFLLSQVEKKEGNLRVASKGLCGINIDNDEAILFEVNAETDFVAKNEHFIKLVHDIGDVLIQSDVTNPKTALAVTIGHHTVGDYIRQISGIIGEHVFLRRFYRVAKMPNHAFGSYIHQGGKVVTLIIIDQDKQDLARDLAMQVAANSPSYVSLPLMDVNTIEYERFMYEKAHETVDEASWQKYLLGLTLYGQPFIRYTEKSIESILEEHHVHVIDFFRFELGQGIDNKLNCRLDIPCDGSKITVTPIF